VLTQPGIERLEAAITTAQDQEKYGKRFTQAELAERTGLSIKTIKKIRQCTGATDAGSIRLLFGAFGLELVASDYGVPEIPEAISSQPGASATKTTLSAEERLSLIQAVNGLPPSQFEEIVYALDLPRGIVATGMDAQGNRAKALLDWAEGPTGCGIDEVLNLLAKYIPLDTIRTLQDVQELAGYSEAPIVSISSTSLQASNLDDDVAPKVDWGEKPDTAIFFGRTEELATLDQWVMAEQCRVVTLLGIGGIGKTSLTAKLADQIYERFDYVIWRSLREAPPLDEVLVRLIQFLSDQQETEINLPSRLGERIIRLLHYLREHRCLLVLDNLESILQAESTGQFHGGYEGYGELIRRLGEAEHQSCLLLTSRECPRDLAPMAGDRLPVRLWSVTGIDTDAGREILKAKGLELDEADAQGQELIRRYSGNPQALHLVATAIQREFLGDVDEFLAEEGTAVEDVRSLLDQHLTRLAPLERSILFWLAINREPVGLDELMEDLLPPLTKREVRKALRGLSDRYLIETLGKQFTLQNVIMEFATNRIVDQARNELEEQKFDLLHTHALIKATAKNYVRETQIRQFLKPIIDSIQNIHEKVKDSLEHIHSSSSWVEGYAPGNFLNILCEAFPEVHMYNFSNLVLRQVHLKGKKLHNLNLEKTLIENPSLTQNFSNICAVIFSIFGDFLATGDGNGYIQVWRIRDWQLYNSFEGHTNEIRSLAFSPDGRYLASGGADSKIRLWNNVQGKCLCTFHDHTDLVWSIAFSPCSDFLVSGSADNTVRLWSIKQKICLQKFKGHTHWVWSVAFSPCGKFIASGSADTTVRLWNVKSNEVINVFRGHDDYIRSLDFSPCGQFLASGSNDSTIRIWDLRSGRNIHSLNGHTDWVWSVVFSPDGNFLASSGDCTVRLWNVQEGRCIHIFTGHKVWIRTVSFSPNGKYLASGSNDCSIRLWDVDKKECIYAFEGYANFVRSLDFSPDGNYIASSSSDTKIRLWNSTEKKCDFILEGHIDWVRSVAFSPCGRLLASGSGDGTVRLWDVNLNRCIFVFEGHTDWIRSVAFSPCGRLLASGSGDRTVRLWDIQQRTCKRVLLGHSNWVRTVVFSNDGKILASGSSDATICLWDTQNLECMYSSSEHTSGIRSLDFSSDNNFLASCSDDNLIRIFDIKQSHLFSILEGHESWVLSVAFNPKKLILASGGGDYMIKIWDVRKNSCLHTLQGHTNRVEALVFSPNGETLASGSDDGQIRLWSIQTGKCLAVMQIPRPYEGTNITGVKGLTRAQQASMLTLGAVDYSFQRYARYA